MLFVAALAVALLGLYHLFCLKRYKMMMGLLGLQFVTWLFWSKDWEVLSVGISLAITAVLVGGAHLRAVNAQKAYEAQLDAEASHAAELHRRAQRLIDEG